MTTNQRRSPVEAPTVESHPYRLGLVVYRTLADAQAAKARTQETYPDAPLPIKDRRTNEVVA